MIVDEMSRERSEKPTDATDAAAVWRVRAAWFAAIAVLLLGVVVMTAMLTSAAGWDAAATPTLKIDVNTADAATLQMLSGVGPALAEGIIEERQRRPFTDAQDLQRVRGIGPVIADRLEPHIVFGADAP